MESSRNIILERRQIIATFIGGTALTVWYKPILSSVVLPVHAQTSQNGLISVASLDADNPFSRYALIVDANDKVLANCGASGGTATAQDLASGTYRVFADSNGLQDHKFSISTMSTNLEVTVPTNTGACNYLIATVMLPSGVITPGTGNQVNGSWDCLSNLGKGCS